MLPAIFRDRLFDDWMRFPNFGDFYDFDKKFYGANNANVMNTDVVEHDDRYAIDIDLPGFGKEDLSLALENGYLTVTAQKNADNEEKNDEGKLIRRERYQGTMQRSFYIGENLTEEDIKARFENGVLSLTVPKKDAPELPEKKTIMIEG
ncbi:MAG: Hsp20/alpha crystallin family protein [Clostridia bacterium]|nr:Hsp20/alpha crystallin family protein [Clostridia bacterium]MBQ1434899.1 Hsp20/alpha crystallin family protein [Clostridia bacterium]